jgi:hypothetical protein
MHYMAGSTRHEEDMKKHPGLFTYDSSVLDDARFSGPDDFEKPVNLMEGKLFSPLATGVPMEEAKRRTRRMFEAAAGRNQHVVFDLHQRSLSRCFAFEREYILWLYDELDSKRVVAPGHAA